MLKLEPFLVLREIVEAHMLNRNYMQEVNFYLFFQTLITDFKSA